MDSLEYAFKGNKNEIEKKQHWDNPIQTIGTIGTIDTNVQHELNGQQHAHCLFMGNKNRTASKLSGMLKNMNTANKSNEKLKICNDMNSVVHRHETLLFKGTDAVCFIMKDKFNYPNLCNYIDNLIYTGLPGDIQQSYEILRALVAELGLEISPSKLTEPI